MPGRINNLFLCVGLLLLTGTLCFGQESASATRNVLVAAVDLPDAPSSVAQQADNSMTTTTTSRRRQSAPPAAEGSWIDGASHAADARYWGMTSLLFSSSIANAELTMRCIGQHTCAYVPPTFRRRLALYGIGFPADLGVSYFSLKMKERGARWWWIPDAAITAANVYVGIHAARELR
jgi:hypothetical protein